jgi:hypothetical protein
MKKSHVIAAICVLLLGGCAHIRGIPTFEERSHPQVTVDKDGIVVSPKVLYYFPHERDVQIVWQLPRGGQYKFLKKDGIIIDGELVDKVLKIKDFPDSVALDKNQREIVDCKAISDVEFACLNRHSRPGVYKYTIRVEDGKNPPLQRDPPMVNM